MKIAIVGGGIAGLSAALSLQANHQVTLLEGASRLGGHAHTLVFDYAEDRGIAVDVGFMMLNDRNYPHFMRLLRAFPQIELVKTSVSFSYSSADDAVAHWFGDPGTPITGLSRLLMDILKFGRRCMKDVSRLHEIDLSLGEYLRQLNVSQSVIDYYVVPSTAAIWSTPPDRILSEFPASTYLAFMNNHGMLSRDDPPTWYSIKGGSANYVAELERRLTGEIVRGEKVTRVSRNAVTWGNTRQAFDHVVLACPADRAMALLDDDFPRQREALGGFPYQENDVVVHTDTSVLPKDRTLWGAWNVRQSTSGAAYSISYHLNQLQDLSAARRDYLVTLNPTQAIPEDKMIYRTRMFHPLLTRAARSSQKALTDLQGSDNLWFCGSYMGFGFHEDAIVSSMAVVEGLGSQAAW